MTHHSGSAALHSMEAVDTLSSQSTTTESSSSSHSHFSRFAAFQHKRSQSRTATEPVQAVPTNNRRSFFRSRSKSPVPPTHSHSLPVRKSQDRPRDGHVHAATVGGTTSPSRVAFQDYSDGAMIERTTSPVPMSPRQRTTSTPSPHNLEFSHRSSTNSHSSRKSGDHKRLSGTVNHCGRHGNDWLFGGFSVRESVGKLWKDDEEK